MPAIPRFFSYLKNYKLARVSEKNSCQFEIEIGRDSGKTERKKGKTFLTAEFSWLRSSPSTQGGAFVKSGEKRRRFGSGKLLQNCLDSNKGRC